MSPTNPLIGKTRYSQTRREFLADVGRGMLIASVGSTAASGLGLAQVSAEEPPATLEFGAIESLVRFMQETAPEQLIGGMAEKIRNGIELRQLVAAAALANARTFGGEDYVGFHTMMALAPALHMSQELPKSLQPLPVLKVAYRNTKRIQERGGRANEVLHRIEAAKLDAGQLAGERLLAEIHRKDIPAAEQTLAAVTQVSPEEGLNQLLYVIGDHTEVHRVVMPYRAWDLMNLIGQEHANTLLRQSIHYCVQAESWPKNAHLSEPASVISKLFDEHHLLAAKPGTRAAEDGWVSNLSDLIFRSTPEQAAHATGAALAEGISPEDVSEAISLAANQLILRDHGRPPREESPGKPPGSVHGDSIGVHACDSACAWRNLARVSNTRNKFACLMLGAYQVAFDRVNRGGDFLNWDPLPDPYHLRGVKAKDPEGLLKEADEAIRQNLQSHSAAIVHQYGAAGFDARPAFDLLLRYAVSEDGSLHAEKYYRTVTEEFSATRPAFRWRQLVALARVTASEYGRPAPGIVEAREVLKV
jgi:hypothetical protein